MKKVQNYVKNLGNSVKYAAADILKDMSPNMGEIIETNSELFKEINYVIRERKTMVRRVSNLMKRSKVYEAGDALITSVFQDISSGTLYNRERKNKFEIKALGMEDLMSGSDFDMDFGDDEGFGSFDDFDVSDGDEYVADIVETSSKASAEMISSSVARSSEYIVESQRSMYEHNMMHNSLLFGNMNSMLSTINSNIGNLILFNDGAHKIHIENSKKYYEETTSIMKESNALLKELVEMDRNRYGKELKDEKSTGSSAIRYNDVVSASGIPDLKQYFKAIGKNVNNELSSTMGMADMFEGNALLALVGSPLEFIPKMLVSKMIDGKFKASLGKLDKSISGFFSALITRFNSMAEDEDNFLASSIGKVFGVRNDLDLKIDNSKYKKGAMPWDGEAKKALTEVIPAYLSRLVALQSGQKETVFDYSSGKFRTRDEIKKEYDNTISSSVKSSTFEIRDAMEQMLKSFAFKEKDTKDNLSKDMTAFFEYFFKSGKMFDHNRKDYEDYEGLTLSSEDNYNLIRSMFKNLPRDMQLNMSRDIMSGRSNLNSRLRLEEENGSMYTHLNDGFGENYNKIGNRSGNYTSISRKRTNRGNTDELAKYTNEQNQKANFTEKESERAGKYNLKYIEDLIAMDDPNVMKNIIKGEIENKEILALMKENSNTKKKDKRLHDFVEDLIGSSLSDKFKMVSGKIKNTSQSPWNFLTGMVDRIDLRLYEVIYGKDEKDYRGESVKGFLDMMMVDLRNTFDTFNTWMDEKILTPLSERFKGTGTNMINSLFSLFGLDITAEDIKGGISGFMFGEKGEDGTRSGGILSSLVNNVKADMNTMKNKVLGPNAGIMKIVKILTRYGNDPTLNNIDDQLMVLSEIEEVVNNGFNPKTDKEIELKNHMISILDSFNTDNPGQTILNIGTAINSSGLNIYNKSIVGILKANVNNAKRYIFGEEKTNADKIQQVIYQRALNPLDLGNMTQGGSGSDEFRDGEEDGSHSDGIANIPYDNYKAKLHKNERVITKGDNDNLIDLFVNDIQAIKEKLYSNNGYINDIRDIAKTSVPNSPLEGQFKLRTLEILDKFTGNNVDEILDQVLEEANRNVEQRGSNTRQSLLGKIVDEFRGMIRATKKSLYGGDGEPENIEKDKDKFLDAAMKDFKANFKDYLPKLGSGALLGGGIGLIPGLIGGPMMWASVGAATAMVNNSEDLQNYLFGEKGEDGKRGGGKLLSGKALAAIDKYAPDAKKFGITGAALSLTPLLPGGPITGFMLGSAVSFAKNNAGVQNFLFGEDGLIGPKAKEKVEKLLPKAILGTIGTGIGGAMLTGSAFGPFGLLGGAAIGTAVALASDTDKFKKAIFGEKDEDGVMQGGLVPMLRDVTITPLKEGAGTLAKGIKTFAEENMKKPFMDAMEPFKKEIGLIAHTMKDAIKNSINSVFEKSFGEPLGDLVKNHIVTPFKNIFKKLFTSIGKLLGNIVSSPFRAMSYAGNELKIKHMKSGDADYLTPEQQDEMIRKHPFKFLFGSKTFSRAFAHLLGVSPEEEYTNDKEQSEKKEDPEDPISDAIEESGLNKPSFIKKMNDKILEKYNNMSASYKAAKESISSKFTDGKNKFLNKVELAARAGMSKESETSSSSDDEPASSSNTTKSNKNNDSEAINKLLAERDDKISTLQEKIDELTGKKKSSYKSPDDDSEGSTNKDLSVIKNHTILISNEVAGQLDGVGYNLETIKNILVDNLGAPENEATGLGTSRGNKSRRGMLGQIFDFLKNPTQKLKGVMTNILFGKDGEGGMLGWINKGLRGVKEILLAPLKIVKEVFGVIKGIGTVLGEAVKSIGPAVAEALKGAVKLISAPLVAVSKIIVGFGEGLGKATSWVVEGLGAFAGSLLEMTSLIPKTISLLGEFSLALTDGILSIGKAVGKFIGGTAKFIGGAAKFGLSALFKDKVKVENIMSMKLEGGYLDSVKNIETVKIIEKINNIPTSADSNRSDGMYTRFGKIRFRKDYKGEEVPIKDSIYMKNLHEETSDNNTMTSIKDLMKESVDDNKETKKSIGFIDKMKNGFNSFFSGISLLKPLLFLALPFLPQIATGIRGLLEGLGISSKAMVDTGVKVTKSVTSWAWDKSHDVLDSPERSVYNYAAQRGIPSITSKLASLSAKKASVMKTGTTAWNTIKKTNLGSKVDDVAKPIASKLSKIAPKNAISSIVSKIDDVFKSPAVRKVMGEKFANAMQGFGKAILSKVDDGIVLSIGKKVANFIPYLNAALFAADIASGMAEAENILMVDGKIPLNVRIMAGIIKAVNQFFFFGLIPMKLILDTIMNLMPTFDDERETISQGQKVLLEKYNEYKRNNPGTKVTFSDFNDSENFRTSQAFRYNKDPNKKYEKAESKAKKKKGSNSGRGLTNSYGRGLSDIFMVNDGAGESKKESHELPFFSQKDPKWNKKTYNMIGETANQTIGNSGCGPTAAAMVISGLTGNTVTPDTAADYAIRNKYKEYNGGTLPEFFTSFSKEHGVNSIVKELDGQSNSPSSMEIISKLKQNNPVILMGKTNNPTSKTPFGKSPHYVVATGIDTKNNVLVHDPEQTSGGKKFKLSDTLKFSQLGILSEGLNGNMIMGEDGMEPELSLWDRWMNLYHSGKEAVTNFLTGGSVSNNEFIQRIIPGAMKSFRTYGILPSITIAQAILESDFGKKSIDNNIFGIKAGSSWTGKTKTVMTTEYRNGIEYKERHTFRAYDTVEDSILDHGKLVGTAKRYESVRKAKNYKDAAKAIYKAGYATDPKYPNKLINLIEKYSLYSLDSGNINALSKSYSYNSITSPTGIAFTKNVRGSKGNVVGKANMHDWFTDRFRKISEDYNNSKISITSGYRDKSDQLRLWNERKAKYPNETDAQRSRWVANPNKGSLHQHGVAADVAKGWLRNLPAKTLAEYGLWRPLAHEPWHFEPIETGYPNSKTRSSSMSKLKSGVFGLPGNPGYVPSSYKTGGLSAASVVKGNTIMHGLGKNTSISKASNAIYGLGSSNDSIKFKPEDLSVDRYNNISPTPIRDTVSKFKSAITQSKTTTNSVVSDNRMMAVLIQLLTHIVENTSNLSEVVRLLSEGLNINIPESKLNKLKSSDKTAILPSITNILSDSTQNLDNTDTIHLVNMLNAIAAQ